MFTSLIFLTVVIQIIHGEDISRTSDSSSIITQRCARAAGACLLAPEATEGPYYWNSTIRRDIT